MKKLLIILFLNLTAVGIAQEQSKFGKITIEELNQQQYTEEPNADAVYLLKKKRTYFEYSQDIGFYAVTEFHDRIQIFNKEGLKFATKTISFRNKNSELAERVKAIKGYTFNIENNSVKKTKLKSKNIFTTQKSKYVSEKKISFPQAKQGSIIDLKYTITSPAIRIKTHYFQYEIPVKLLDYTIQIPEYFSFQKLSKGFYLPKIKETNPTRTVSSTTKTRSGMYVSSTSFKTNKLNFKEKTYKIQEQNISSVNYKEPYIGNINNYRGAISFELQGIRYPRSAYQNYTTTWEKVCSTIYNIGAFGQELKKSSYFSDDLAKLQESSANELETALNIFSFVQNKMEWNKYISIFTSKGVKSAYKEEVGNVAEINLILTAMLQKAGLDANPVVLSTKSNGIPLFPTIDQLNYVITKVNFADSYLLLDASDKFTSPNILPTRAINWIGKEVKSNGQISDVQLAPNSHSTQKQMLYLKLENQNLKGMLRSTYSGHSNKFFQESNVNKSKATAISEIENEYNIELNDDLELKLNNTLKGTSSRKLKFSTDNFIETINGKLHISPFVFLAQTTNPFTSETRNTPIDYTIPWAKDLSISISIPDNYSIESLPKNTTFNFPDNIGIFNFKVTQKGNKINVKNVYAFNTGIIPQNYYQSVKEFYNTLIKAQTQKIILKKN